jgi:hypothetical protein
LCGAARAVDRRPRGRRGMRKRIPPSEGVEVVVVVRTQ